MRHLEKSNVSYKNIERAYIYVETVPSLTWPSCVTQPPSEIEDTFNPVRPRNRYSIFGVDMVSVYCSNRASESYWESRCTYGFPHRSLAA